MALAIPPAPAKEPLIRRPSAREQFDVHDFAYGQLDEATQEYQNVMNKLVRRGHTCAHGSTTNLDTCHYLLTCGSSASQRLGTHTHTQLCTSWPVMRPSPLQAVTHL